MAGVIEYEIVPAPTTAHFEIKVSNARENYQVLSNLIHAFSDSKPVDIFGAKYRVIDMTMHQMTGNAFFKVVAL